MTTTNDIDAIRRLTDAATSGPWKTGDRFGNRSLGSSVVVPAGNLPPIELDPHRNGRNDARFIAAARTLVPALCDEVEQLREQVMQFAGQLGSAHGKQTVLRGQMHDTEAELEKMRAQLTAANRANDGYKADERYTGRAALTEYRDANHRHNNRAPGWCICGDDWDDEGCDEYIGLTEAAQLYTGEKAEVAS